MPRPIPLAIRQTIVTLRQRGYSQPKIADQIDVSLSSVKTILRRFRDEGQAGLETRYHRCGQQQINFDQFTYRCYKALRIWHPGWGYDKISSIISNKYGTIQLPDRRTVYRWWKALGLVQSKTKPPRSAKAWAVKAHDIWQIDAKEMMHIDSDQPHCWLNIVDEFTGGVIDPPVFPPRKD